MCSNKYVLKVAKRLPEKIKKIDFLSNFDWNLQKKGDYGVVWFGCLFFACRERPATTDDEAFSKAGRCCIC
ncbi:MAG: hypothetical protein ACI9JY_002247 [Saprospiraceae bacterium]|jgi:hypothetical protein